MLSPKGRGINLSVSNNNSRCLIQEKLTVSLLYKVFTGESSFLSHPICLVNEVYASGRLDSTCDSTETLLGVLELKKRCYS